MEIMVVLLLVLRVGSLVAVVVVVRRYIATIVVVARSLPLLMQRRRRLVVPEILLVVMTELGLGGSVRSGLEQAVVHGKDKSCTANDPETQLVFGIKILLRDQTRSAPKHVPTPH
jgi:hypothetical protein